MSPPPFLAVDIGNSSVKAAVWDEVSPGGALAWTRAVTLGHTEAPARLEALAWAGLKTGVASVVPVLTASVADALQRATGRTPTVVSARLPLPFAMAYATPETLGPDRLAAAVAAWHLGGGRPVVALDAGTALTLDAVDVRDGRPVYLGGAIAPGPALMVAALATGTAALPDVALGREAPPIGTSTREAIQAGVEGLFAGGALHLLRTTSEALSAPPVVVATGGLGPWLYHHGLPIDVLTPTLVLDGVRLLSGG